MGVSILIPAFRPTYLRQALASALTQGVEDLEILVSDDSGGEAVQPVVEQFRDPRIKYSRTAGRIGATPNCTALWNAAKYDLIQFLLDDDLLMPHALPELLAQAERRPDASLYFGSRYVIDAKGRITGEAAVRDKPVIEVNGPNLTASFVPMLRNPVGEFTNVLMNRKVGLTAQLYETYMGYELRVLGDVAFYLCAGRLGPAIGINRPVAAFRIHGDQRSSPDANPTFAIGLAEWEIFVRGELSDGRINAEQALSAIGRLKTAYEHWGQKLPTLLALRPGVDDLQARVEAGDTALLDDAFRARWDTFVASVIKPAG